MAAIQRKEAVVAYEDGRVERYRITPKVEMYFERVYGKTVGSLADGGQTSGFQLVWEAMREAKKGSAVLALEAWLETTEAITVEMVDIVPLESSPPSEGSPLSQSPRELRPVS